MSLLLSLMLIFQDFKYGSVISKVKLEVSCMPSEETLSGDMYASDEAVFEITGAKLSMMLLIRCVVARICITL